MDRQRFSRANTRQRVAHAVIVATLAIGCMPADDGDGDPRACDRPAAPAPAGSTEPEAAPDFEQRLADTDVAGLPDSLDTSQLTELERAWLGYALVVAPDSIADTLPRDEIPDTPLGAAIEAAFARGSSGRLDFDLLRQAVHRLYPCDRDIPATLDAFAARYGDYRTFPSREIAMSVPKLSPRTLYEDVAAGIFVAETALDEGGLEIEVIVAGARPDGALEFFGYGPDGTRLGWADLAVSGDPEPLPVPFTCALCHRDLAANSFSVVDPS